MTRKPRTDAVHNRVHILDVARQSFAEDGLDLPVREIARRAGIGVATVYRHFPARPDLVAAVLDERVRACTAEMREALADPDPWARAEGHDPPVRRSPGPRPGPQRGAARRSRHVRRRTPRPRA
ncbi:MAG TPA: helix-turn-helix domain-containing protein [Pseudonocardiaceae bacterium]|nr:helix-turn-helix domain-containing protein [Pseudonocardiaceae bacterium]